MKNIVFLIIVIFTISVVYNANAQYCAGYKNKAIKDLPNTKTLVALSGDEAYDKVLKEAIQTYWKHTQCEFITMEEVDKRITEVNSSFIVPVTFTMVEEQHQLALIMGGKPSLDKYNILHLTSYVIIDGMNMEKDYKKCAYRLPHMIKSLNDAITIALEKQIGSNASDKMEEYYNASASKIKSKTLLINKEYISPTLKEEDIKELYPFPYEIVETAKVEEAIKNKDEKYCYLLRPSTRISFTFVFDAASGEVWYAESNNKLDKKAKIKLLTTTIGN